MAAEMDITALLIMAANQGVPGNMLLPVGLASLGAGNERAPAFYFSISQTVWAISLKADAAHGLPWAMQTSALEGRYVDAGAPILSVAPSKAESALRDDLEHGFAFRHGDDAGWVITVPGYKERCFVTTRGSVIDLPYGASVDFWREWSVSSRDNNGTVREVYSHAVQV